MSFCPSYSFLRLVRNFFLKYANENNFTRADHLVIVRCLPLLYIVGIILVNGSCLQLVHLSIVHLFISPLVHLSYSRLTFEIIEVTECCVFFIFKFCCIVCDKHFW